MTRRRRLLLAALAALVALSHAPRAHAEQPWHKPFTAKPADILAAAGKVPVAADAGIVILLAETHLSFDEQGRATRRIHWVFRVETRAGARDWGTLRMSWSPWYQNKPTLRVRVVTPDGTAHALDPTTINEVVARSTGHVSSDRRRLEVPLPALTPGAVVEEELVVVDHRPHFAAGITTTEGFGTSVAVEEQRLVVDAPRSLKLRYRAHLLPELKRSRSRHGKRTRWTFTAAHQSAHSKPESNLPSDIHRYPNIALSTAPSWHSVATAYAAVVDRQIGAGTIDDAILAPMRAASGRRARIEAALALVNDNVRYSGLELGESSITPWTPAQTWKRKYGDCKDKATLLVAILARVGIDARVALLSTGPGVDVDPDLPGMGGFDHAIVYLPGKRPMWIDPTAVFARAGELPAGDQDRLALIAHPSTKQLIRTPAPSSRANRLVEKRVIRLAELGGGAVVETTTAHGWFELDYRSSYRNVGKDKRKEILGDWIAGEYKSDNLTSYRHTDVEDLSTAFELRLEAKDADRAISDEEEAVVFLKTYTLIAYLPDELKQLAKPGKERTQDYLLRRPYTYEIHHEIIPAPGFAPRPLPAAQIIQLGPATLTTSYRRAGTTVIADYRFEIAKRRLSPADVTALGVAVTALGNSDMTKIGFEQVGMALLDKGEFRAAIAELCKLVKLHPKEALHRRQLALAFLAAGMGQTARAQARWALKLEPNSAAAHFTLAWILEHDLIGRHFGAGFERGNAIASYRRAIAIDAKAPQYHANLALVLERDQRGRQYAGDLAAAIAEYQLVHAAGDDSYDINLMIVLSRAQRWSELIDLTRKLPEEGNRNGYLIAAIAARDGTVDAMREANSLFRQDDTRRLALEAAMATLMTTRHYPEAATLARMAAAGKNSSAELRGNADLLDRIRPFAQSRSRAGTPERAVEDFLLSPILDTPETERRMLLGQRMRDVPIDATDIDIDTADMPIKVMLDLGLSLISLKLEPSKWGTRVRIHETSSNEPPDYIYLIRENKRWAIVPADTGEASGAFAIEALYWLDKGEVAGGKQWLQWAADAIANASINHSEFATFWSATSQRTPARLRLAAAALASDHAYSADLAIPILEKCPRNNPATTEACDVSLYIAYNRTQRFDDLAALGDRVAAENCTSDRCWRIRIAPFFYLENWAKASRRASAFVKSQPRNSLAHFFLATARLGNGDSAGAKRAFAKAGNLGSISGLNQRAWMTIIEDQPPDDTALFAAVRAVSRTQRKDSSVLNTQAAVHAARGELELAYEVMIESMVVDGVAEPRRHDWLVYAMIAAGYGLEGAALAALDKITPETPPQSLDSHAIAAHWRSRLARKCKSKPAAPASN